MLVKVEGLGGSTGMALGCGPDPRAMSVELRGGWWVVRGTGEEAAGISHPTAGSRSISIIVVEDHVLVREGTAELLSRQGGLSVVGQAGSAEEALELLSDLRPDVALVDVELPGMSGIALARQASDRGFDTRVLILSAYDDYAYVIEALEAGVAGYLLKTSSARELADAVRTAADGALVLDQAISGRLIHRWRSGPGSASPALTSREADVLRLIARGQPNKQIATQLGLGLRTVESHVSSLLGKLGVSSRTEAALYAVSHKAGSQSREGRRR